MEILQPAKLVDDAKTDDSDSLLLAEHCKASSKAWEEEVEVGSGVYPPPTLLVVGEQSEAFQLLEYQMVRVGGQI